MTASRRGEQVLRAAVSAFAESGYAATRTDEIARRAGVSQPYSCPPGCCSPSRARCARRARMRYPPHGRRRSWKTCRRERTAGSIGCRDEQLDGSGRDISDDGLLKPK
ncbi:TetR/AcrR family transcriptional regulator [Nocardia barduliensis]|uniref:TetR/AcrR family transcriptional regulator n=1 Tax=Nocardia barduliensis TaxID=2736643 RepID=UPI001FEBFB09|nr:helix-turn-helix domain-containing protein [Nocardia barduliensis]